MKYDYDVMIIGAGISGLVCGCYLAKAGLKTLIVEKNAKPGGYCTSFTKKGFNFDACVYSLSSIRNGGSLKRIIDDFKLDDRIKFLKNDIPNIVVTPNYNINFFSDVNKTINELQGSFPTERNSLKKFFEYISSSSVLSISKLRNMTFSKILNGFFYNPELKTILSIMLLGYTSLPPSRLSSLVGCLVYREFIFDGGYYPIGGMQAFPDILLKKFVELKGEIAFSTKVQRIEIKNNKTTGVIIETGKFLSSRFVIASCDSHETFCELIDANSISKGLLIKSKNIEQSLSAFLVYLGIKKNLKHLSHLKSHIWIINKNFNNIEKIYFDLLHGLYDFIAITSSSVLNSFSSNDNSRESLFLYVNTPFKTKSFWNGITRAKIEKKLINIAMKFVPEIKNHIALKFNATPLTLYKWTLNYKGACYGLADTISQFAGSDFSESTEINNLFLSGHWVNKSSGITSVVNSARITSERIIHSINNKLLR